MKAPPGQTGVGGGGTRAGGGGALCEGAAKPLLLSFAHGYTRYTLTMILQRQPRSLQLGGRANPSAGRAL